MISTLSKVVMTGMACGTLGLGLGGVWAAREDIGAREPMQHLQKPAAIAQLVKPVSESLPGAQGPSPTEPVRARAGEVLPARPAAAAPTPESPSVGHPEAQNGLSVTRLVVTDRIEDREPVEADQFTTRGAQVYAFVELSNSDSEDHKIEIVFEHESGQKVGFVQLPVPKDKRRWRTWGKTQQIKKSGRWVATVRTEEGTELMRQAFVVGQG